MLRFTNLNICNWELGMFQLTAFQFQIGKARWNPLFVQVTRVEVEVVQLVLKVDSPRHHTG